MVCNAIVARLDPVQSMMIVASILLFFRVSVNNALKKTEESKIDANIIILCAGSRRATIALQTILKTSEFGPFI